MNTPSTEAPDDQHFTGHHEKVRVPHGNLISVTQLFRPVKLPFSFRPVRIKIPSLPERSVVAFAPNILIRDDLPNAGDGYILERPTRVKALKSPPGRLVTSQRFKIRENLLDVLRRADMPQYRDPSGLTIEGFGRFFVAAAADINGELEHSRDHISALMNGLLINEETDTELVINSDDPEALAKVLVTIGQMRPAGGDLRIRLHAL